MKPLAGLDESVIDVTTTSDPYSRLLRTTSRREALASAQWLGEHDGIGLANHEGRPQASRCWKLDTDYPSPWHRPCRLLLVHGCQYVLQVAVARADTDKHEQSVAAFQVRPDTKEESSHSNIYVWRPSYLRIVTGREVRKVQEGKALSQSRIFFFPQLGQRTFHFQGVLQHEPCDAMRAGKLSPCHIHQRNQDPANTVRSPST